MHDQQGFAFKSNTGPKDLLTKVEDHLHKLEKEIYGYSNPPGEVDLEILADNHYAHYDDPNTLDMYIPGPGAHEPKLQKKVHVEKSSGGTTLSEPEKAFMGN